MTLRALPVAMACALAAMAPCQKKPTPKSVIARPPLAQRLKATEDKLAKMAANHQRTMEQLSKVEAQIDQWTKTIAGFRQRLEKHR